MSLELAAGMWCLPNRVVHRNIIALSRELGMYPTSGMEMPAAKYPYIFVYSAEGKLTVAESARPVQRKLCTEVNPGILTVLMKAHANRGDDGE